MPSDSAAASLVESDLIALALLRDGQIRFANAAFHALFRRDDDIIDTPFVPLLREADRERVETALRSAGSNATTLVAEALRGDGAAFDAELRLCRLASGQDLVALFAQDVTDRTRIVEQLQLLAFSDPLTGLANRALFADRLRHAALDAQRGTRRFAVMMLDLDGFKPINDQFGHAAGDEVLQQVAHRFRTALRESDTVARYGGDEFAIVLPRGNNAADVTHVAERLLQAARQPIHVGRHDVSVSACAGIASFPEHGCSAEHLLVAADTALYAAKRTGRGRYAWFDPATDTQEAAPAIAWSAAHEVGIALMDRQHAELAERVNQLASALRNGQEHGAPLQEVIRFAACHFAAEEHLMLGIDYPDAPHHRELHRRLLEEIGSIDVGGDDASTGLLVRYLSEWLFRHVDGPDRSLAAALRTAKAGTGAYG